MIKTALIAVLKKALSKDKKVLFSYIYGSFLKRKDARDIDVAVYLKNPGDPWREENEISESLERAIQNTFSVDVHVLNESPAAFRFNVLSTGKLLMDKNKKQRLNWEAHSVSYYLDVKPMLDFHDRKFLAR